MLASVSKLEDGSAAAAARLDAEPEELQLDRALDLEAARSPHVAHADLEPSGERIEDRHERPEMRDGNSTSPIMLTV